MSANGITIDYIVRETNYPDATKQEVIGELVRCRDCRYYGNTFGLSAGADSERWCFLLGLVGAFDKDDYCSHGERRSDGTR